MTDVYLQIKVRFGHVGSVGECLTVGVFRFHLTVSISCQNGRHISIRYFKKEEWTRGLLFKQSFLCVCVLKLIDDDATTTRAQNVIKREATDELHSTERCQNIQLVSRFVSSPLLLLLPFYVRTSTTTTTHIHRYCSSLALSAHDDDAGYTQLLYPPSLWTMRVWKAESERSV
jgi:hypothetical protein